VIWAKLTQRPFTIMTVLLLSVVSGHYIAGFYAPSQLCHSQAQSLLLSIFYVVGSRTVLAFTFLGLALVIGYLIREWKTKQALRAGVADALTEYQIPDQAPDLDVNYLHHNWFSWMVSDGLAQIWTICRTICLFLLWEGSLFWLIGFAILISAFWYADAWASQYLCAVDMQSRILVGLFGVTATALCAVAAKLVTRFKFAERFEAHTGESSQPYVLEYRLVEHYSLYWLNHKLYQYDIDCPGGNILRKLLETQCKSLPGSDAQMLRFRGKTSCFRWVLQDLDGNVVYSIHISGRVYVQELNHEFDTMMPVIASTIRERLLELKAKRDLVTEAG
jgi:hypothetical protein